MNEKHVASASEEKSKQEATLIGRIISLEGLLLLMGFVSLGYGIMNGAEMNIFWGVVIIPGVWLLAKVRKKDWKKHWEELEAEQKRLAERRQQRDDRPPREE